MLLNHLERWKYNISFPCSRGFIEWDHMFEGLLLIRHNECQPGALASHFCPLDHCSTEEESATGVKVLGFTNTEEEEKHQQQKWHSPHWFEQYVPFYNKHLKTLRQSCQNKWAPCSRAPRQWSENVLETGLDPETLRLPAQPTKATPEASSNKKRIYVAIFWFSSDITHEAPASYRPGPNPSARPIGEMKHFLGRRSAVKKSPHTSCREKHLKYRGLVRRWPGCFPNKGLRGSDCSGKGRHGDWWALRCHKLLRRQICSEASLWSKTRINGTISKIKFYFMRQSDG